MFSTQITETWGRGSRGEWEYAKCAPVAQLTELIHNYHGYQETAPHFPTRRELPRAGVMLVVSLGGETRFTDPRRPSEGIVVDSYVAGIHDTHIQSFTTSPWLGIRVDFTPLGAYSFFGSGVAQLSNRIIPSRDILGPAATRLGLRLRSETSWPERFRILQEFVHDRMFQGPKASLIAERGWQSLRASGGNRRISDLAAGLGCSRKYLTGQFNDHFGTGPKTMARVLRFQHACSRLAARTSDTMTQVAARTGYFDHAHMVRDFHQFAGGPPTSVATVGPEALTA